MAHGLWEIPACNVLIARPQDRPKIDQTKSLKHCTIQLKDFYPRGDPMLQSFARVAPGYDHSNVQWWGRPLSCFTLKPHVIPIHNLITGYLIQPGIEVPITTPYQAGDASVTDSVAWLVKTWNPMTGPSDWRTRLSDGLPRTNSAANERVQQNQYVEVKISHNSLTGDDRLPARPSFRYKITHYEPDNAGEATKNSSACFCSTTDYPTALGDPHVCLTFGGCWSLIFDFTVGRETLVLKKLWNMGKQDPNNNLWFTCRTITPKSNPAAKQMWQNSEIFVDVLHIGSYMVLVLGGDYDSPEVIAPWDTMTVKGQTRYVGDAMGFEPAIGHYYRPFLRTPSKTFDVHMASCTADWQLWPIRWGDTETGTVSVEWDLSAGEHGALDDAKSAVIYTSPPSLASVANDDTPLPQLDVSATNPFVSYTWAPVLDGGGNPTLKARAVFTLHRGSADYNLETPCLHGLQMTWTRDWQDPTLPDWAATTDFKSAVVRIEESQQEPMVGGIDTCSVTLEKSVLDLAYPGWDATIRRYSPIRVYLGYEEADFPATAGVYDDNFCRPIGGPYKTVLRFEGLVVDKNIVQHAGEDNVQIQLVCADWSCLLTDPAGFIWDECPTDLIRPTTNEDGKAGSGLFGYEAVKKIVTEALGPKVAGAAGANIRVFRAKDTDGNPCEYDLVTGHIFKEGASPQNAGDMLWFPRYGGHYFDWVCELAEYECKVYFIRQGVPFYADYWAFLRGEDDEAGNASPVGSHDWYTIPSALSIDQMNRHVTPMHQSEERTSEAINRVVVGAVTDEVKLPAAMKVAIDNESLTDDTSDNYTAGTLHTLWIAGVQFFARVGEGPQDQDIAEVIANNLLARFKGRKPIRAIAHMRGQPDLFWGDRIHYNGGDIGLDGRYCRVLRLESVAEWEPGQKAGPYTTRAILINEYSDLTMV